MSYHAQSDYDPDAALSDADVADTIRERVLCDYLAAREALRRIHHRMSQAEVFAVQDRFYHAEMALLAEQDRDRHMAPANQAMLAEIRGAA